MILHFSPPAPQSPNARPGHNWAASVEQSIQSLLLQARQFSLEELPRNVGGNAIAADGVFSKRFLIVPILKDDRRRKRRRCCFIVVNIECGNHVVSIAYSCPWSVPCHPPPKKTANPPTSQSSNSRSPLPRLPNKLNYPLF